MRAHLRYLSYVVRHKWFVLLAGLKTGAPLWRLLIHDLSKFTPAEWGPYVRYFYQPVRVGDRVLIDSFEGFGGWATVGDTRPSKTEKGQDCKVVMEDGSQPKAFWAWSFEVKRPAIAEAFDRAWLHHQHANPHHWQHWVLREDDGGTKVLQMPEHFVREMVADWAGAGRAITGRWDVASWYAANGHKMQLHQGTRLIVQALLNRRFP